jgi:hypothetical protein
MRINFFIIGVQKGGTTALDSYLRRHPNIQMANIKEAHFFDNDALDWSNPDYAALHRRFNWKSKNIKLRGEATPIYSYWPQSLQRLRQYNASAKLLMSLRHPALRAYSQWRMEKGRNSETLSFSAAIGECGRRRVNESPNGVHRVFSYLERGFYAPQISNALELFPKEHILFFRTDQLWNEASATLDRIQTFLGVDLALNVTRCYISPEHTLGVTEISDNSMRARLDAVFADDIRQTMALTGLDLADWLDARYREPMRPE